MNNAGAPAPGGRIKDLPLDAFDTAFQMHLRGAVARFKFAAHSMRAQGSGSIIIVGSVAGHRAGYSSSTTYGMAKAAVIHMTRPMAMELGEDRVPANSISPGGIATGIFAKSMGMDPAKAEEMAEKVKSALAGLQAVPRAGLTDDIASAALYLASDEANFVNGEDIVVDGGLIWGRKHSVVMAGGSMWSMLFEQVSGPGMRCASPDFVVRTKVMSVPVPSPRTIRRRSSSKHEARARGLAQTHCDSGKINRDHM